MATGVPRRRRSSDDRSTAAIRLDYPGRRDERVILSTPPARSVATAWRGGDANRLYLGENGDVLRHLLNDPGVAGKVRLVYIDPPYATSTVFHSRDLAHAYEDLIDGSEFIEFIRERLILLRELLAPDGSIYVHLDEKMVFHAKLILDEVFGTAAYRNCISRRKCNPKNFTRRRYGNIQDFVLFYAKSAESVWNRPTEPWTEEWARREYPCVDGSGRRYKKVPVHAPGTRNGETGKPWRDMPPPRGKHWQYTPETLDAMDARGEIYWSPTGNPRRKVYLDEAGGVGVQDIWWNFRDAHNQNVEITGYPTEKNLDLLTRVVEASSNEGDLVLDAFSGSGTTLAAASRARRRWIGIDRSPEAIRTTLQRFARGTSRMGDFVQERRRATERAEQRELFVDEPEERRGPASAPIVDFTLHAQDGFDVSALIPAWLGDLPRSA